ncbi:MAG: bifunctional folylpolyglutamate synthase/dihydrofolate synthase, partial [Paramuribaculum sp.]|nr:bifunctional folylpolyglutamate synthase/dihydrofolate synthase [Paramuribaculum sp.]
EIAPVLRLAATIPDATFRFTQASVNRALAASELASRARECGIDGTAYPSVAQAYAAACEAARADDTIFVGGSTFIVADLLAFLQSIDRPE